MFGGCAPDLVQLKGQSSMNGERADCGEENRQSFYQKESPLLFSQIFYKIFIKCLTFSMVLKRKFHRTITSFVVGRPLDQTILI